MVVYCFIMTRKLLWLLVVLLVFGGCSTGSMIVSPILNEFNQNLDTTSNVTFNSINATRTLLVPIMNTTIRDEMTPINGIIIYNSGTNAFNFYENGSWVTK